MGILKLLLMIGLIVLPCNVNSRSSNSYSRTQLRKNSWDRSAPEFPDNGHISEGENGKGDVTNYRLREIVQHMNNPNRKNGESQFHLSVHDQQRLRNIYGPEVVKQHYQDFENAGEIGRNRANDHDEIAWRSNLRNEPVTGIDREIIDDAKLDAVNSQETFVNDAVSKISARNRNHTLDPVVVKNLIQDLLQRLDSYENQVEISQNEIVEESVVEVKNGHCNIHGLWLSAVAGVAIELLPTVHEKHIEIRTKIFNLPDNPRGGIITSDWTGNGLISEESSTTITIVFQEHFLRPGGTASGTDFQAEGGRQQNSPGENTALPKTAVFVGQCLVCESSPVLQGTWVVFPNNQNCLANRDNVVPSASETKSRTQDTIYLLRR